MAQTHFLVGMAAYGLSSANTIAQEPILFGAASLGGLVPDIDHPKSWLGSKFKLISVPVSNLIGHRGLTHSVLGTVSFSLIVFIINILNIDSQLGEALIVGYISHIGADYFTNSGVPLFWPKQKRYRFPWAFNTGGMYEFIVAVIAIAIMLTV